jgi:tetratricopeptide (TPR) repeat protein
MNAIQPRLIAAIALWSGFLLLTPVPLRAESVEIKDVKFWTQRCQSLLDEQIYDEALAACDRAIAFQDAQKTPPLVLWKARSEALLKVGRYWDAITSFDYVLSQEPKYSLGLAFRCDALSKLGRHDGAIASCEEALRLNGDWGRLSPAIAWSFRGQTLRRMGQLDEAIEAYDRAVFNDNADIFLLAERCEALSEANRFDPKSCQAVLGTTDPAWKLPQSAIAWFKRGVMLRRQKSYAEATQSFRMAATLYEQRLAMHPTDVESWIGQGLSLAQSLDYARALTSFDRAVQLHPKSSFALLQQSAMLNQLKHYEPALVAADAALQGNQLWDLATPAAAWVQRSTALVGLNRYSEGIAAADRVLAIQSSEVQSAGATLLLKAIALDNRAVGYWYLQNLTVASESAQQATQQAPHYPQAFFNQGRILSSLKQYEAAIASYEKATQLQQQGIQQGTEFDDRNFAAEISTNRAAVHLRQNQPGQAVTFAKLATQQNPRAFEAWYNYAIASTELAQASADFSLWQQALMAFQQAGQRSPKSVFVWIGQAKAYEALGDKENALKSYDTALRLDANSKLAKTSREELLKKLYQIQPSKLKPMSPR